VAQQQRPGGVRVQETAASCRIALGRHQVQEHVGNPSGFGQPRIDGVSRKQRTHDLPRIDGEQPPLGQPQQDVLAQVLLFQGRDQDLGGVWFGRLTQGQTHCQRRIALLDQVRLVAVAPLGVAGPAAQGADADHAGTWRMAAPFWRMVIASPGP
jgi:hypothetical protein